MPDLPAITVENLGKLYTLAHERRPDTLRDTLAHGARGLWRRWFGRQRAVEREEFWALRDVSFEVPRGEVVGIIGRNGAGKSTLLKILSRITEPTTGRAVIRGRVASLLEVGTGFHPELTGRENIFLNGAILGMKRVEIARKFDEIVAFAEVERFLDTPVKHYSSGMYVRLAFAVAAHVEPEILIVDEVLAVGDAAFQRKCLGKMQDVARTSGRTVLFVSHNLGSVRQLCSGAILLEEGRVASRGACSAVVQTYQGSGAAAVRPLPQPPVELHAKAHLEHVVVESLAGERVVSVPLGSAWRVRVVVRVHRPLLAMTVAVGLRNADGLGVQTAWHPPADLAAGRYEIFFDQDRVILEAGLYTLVVGLSAGNRSLQQEEAGALEITATDAHGYFVGTSGYGLVLNSMTTRIYSLPSHENHG